MKITPELIQYLESLARIELTPAEEATVGDQLQELLTYIDTLSQLDTDGVEGQEPLLPGDQCVPQGSGGGAHDPGRSGGQCTGEPGRRLCGA